MKKIICFFKGHKRGRTRTFMAPMRKFLWEIQCSRCGYQIEYESPHTRLVGREIQLGFTGE